MTAPKSKPLWRQAFDLVETRVSPLLEDVTQTPAFADAARLVVGIDATIRSQAERVSARLWHLANLPAGSDITRLRRQVSALDYEVRQLRTALERREDRSDG